MRPLTWLHAHLLQVFFFFRNKPKTILIWSYSSRNTCLKKKRLKHKIKGIVSLYLKGKKPKNASHSLCSECSLCLLSLSLSNPCSQTHGSIPPSLLKLTNPISLHGMVMYFCIQYSLYYLLLLLNWYMFTIIWKNMLSNI